MKRNEVIGVLLEHSWKKKAHSFQLDVTSMSSYNNSIPFPIELPTLSVSGEISPLILEMINLRAGNMKERTKVTTDVFKTTVCDDTYKT